MSSFSTDTTAFYMLISYILISSLIAALVGQYLYRNGQVFLARLFLDAALATAINKLLLAGFYLVNIGYILLTVNAPDEQFAALHSSALWLQFLCTKIGLAVLVLGLLHLFTLLVLWLLSSRKKEDVDPYATAP